MGATARRVLIGAVAVFVVLAANLLASSLSGIPVAVARRAVAETSQPNAQINLLRARQTGLIGINWISTLDFGVVSDGVVDTVSVRARKRTGFLPWRVEHVERGRRAS